MKKWNFKRVFWATTFIVLFSMLQSCSSAKEPLITASHVWPGYEFMFLADQLGWLDHEKVTLVDTYSASESLGLIKAGEVDAAALTLDEVIRARSEGVELSIVAVFDISAGADQVISRTEFSSLSDIKGKRIGVETSALGAVVLSQVLEVAGLTREDVSIVELTIDDQEQAWLDGRVDCVITYEPVARKLLTAGGVKVFDSRSMPEMILDVLAVRKEALHKQTQIQHLTEAHFKALHHFESQREDALYRMAPRLGVEPDQVPFLYEGLLLPNPLHNQRLMNGTPSKLESVGEKIINVMWQSNLIESQVNVDNLVDPSFVSP